MVLLCGLVVWAKLPDKVSVGSKEEMGGPNCVTMPPPELMPCAGGATVADVGDRDPSQADTGRSRSHAHADAP